MTSYSLPPLDQRILVKKAQSGRTGMGHSKPGFSEGDPLRANFEPVRDSERWQAGRTSATAMARFTVRNRGKGALIGRDDLVTFRGEDWLIIGLKLRGRNLGLEITAVLEG